MGQEDYELAIEPIRTTRTFEEVSNRLKELIFNGTFKPGQRLPSEGSLALLFRVGRQSIREALRILELSGFITIRAGVRGGPIIEDTVHNKIAGLFLDAFKSDKVSLADLVVSRKAIERDVLDLVFVNAKRGDLNRLRENVRQARAKLEKGQLAIEENIEFHRLLALASGNHVFVIVMESILAVFFDFRSKLSVAGGLDRSREITALHEEMIRAIGARKKRRAVALMELNVDKANEILITKTM
jgi:GntR family transcriptional regulator, transcriptional repressor for pyruvate dehydrogenase complex